MPHLNDRIYLELFGENEAVHLMSALLQEGVYEEIRECIARPTVEAEADLNAFGQGTLAGGQLHWAIRDHITHSCLGSLQATLTPDGAISIGYRVRSESQNTGIATEALGLLLKELSSRFPNFPIVASVHPQNIASLRVLAKLSFVEAVPLSGATSVGSNTERAFRYVPFTNGAA